MVYIYFKKPYLKLENYFFFNTNYFHKVTWDVLLKKGGVAQKVEPLF